MDKDTGGQAFPSEYKDITEKQSCNYRSVGSEGMTLRDYFMAHCPEMPKWYQEWREKEYTTKETYFSWRSYYADTMLKERSKE